MIKANPPGRPCDLTPEIHKTLIDAVSEVIIPSQVAARARIPKTTLNRWLDRGQIDAINGEDSIYAQLWFDFKETQSLVVKDCIQKLLTAPRNYQPLVWILERCFRRDFGADSDEIKELIRNLELLAKEKYGYQGSISHGETHDEKAKQNTEL